MNIEVSPQFGHGWVGAGRAVHLCLAPNLKYLELVISFAEIEVEMTAGRDAEFECEMTVCSCPIPQSSFHPNRK